MATTLNIINSFALDSDGLLDEGKQGSVDSLIGDEFSITGVTIAGTEHRRKGSLATATVVTAYNSANDFPATFDYLHFWADVTMYVQVIGSATNAIFKVLAKVPFVLPGFGSVLGAAATTIIAGGAEPAVTAVSKIVIGNYSGGTGNFVLTLID